MLKILVCEDDLHIAEMIHFVLKDKYNVTVVNNGLDAIDVLEEEKFHLIITDIVMPNLDGYELLDYLKDVGDKTPTLILSSLNSETNQIDGYKYNIEDYMVKPFNAELFKNKVITIMGRLYNIGNDDVGVDEENLTVTYESDVIEFTPIEFSVFYHLFINKGKYCSKYDMLDLFWSEDAGDRVVDYTIKRIRKKMGKYANKIVTKTKVGYKYEEN
ncbi:MAG: response regulator transcription factor [Bacilli bacterium]